MTGNSNAKAAPPTMPWTKPNHAENVQTGSKPCDNPNRKRNPEETGRRTDHPNQEPNTNIRIAGKKTHLSPATSFSFSPGRTKRTISRTQTGRERRAPPVRASLTTDRNASWGERMCKETSNFSMGILRASSSTPAFHPTRRVATSQARSDRISPPLKSPKCSTSGLGWSSLEVRAKVVLLLLLQNRPQRSS